MPYHTNIDGANKKDAIPSVNIDNVNKSCKDTLVNINGTWHSCAPKIFTLTLCRSQTANLSTSQTLQTNSDGTVTLPTPSSNGDGSAFFGWATSYTATTRNYTGGQTITLSANTTLYAVYTHQVKLYKYGALYQTLTSRSCKMLTDTSFTYPTCSVNSDDMSFIYWVYSSAITSPGLPTNYYRNANTTYSSDNRSVCYALFSYKGTASGSANTRMTNTSTTCTVTVTLTNPVPGTTYTATLYDSQVASNVTTTYSSDNLTRTDTYGVKYQNYGSAITSSGTIPSSPGTSYTLTLSTTTPNTSGSFTIGTMTYTRPNTSSGWTLTSNSTSTASYYTRGYRQGTVSYSQYATKYRAQK